MRIHRCDAARAAGPFLCLLAQVGVLTAVATAEERGFPPPLVDDHFLEVEIDRDDIRPASLLQDAVPPAPAAEDAAARLRDEALDLRLNSLESEFRNLQFRLQSGELVQGRLRSTDIHPLPPSNRPPTFPNVKVTGFFQADAAWFGQDSASNAQLGNIQNDMGFRRARLAAVGDVSQNVSYMIEMDFAFPGRPSFMDVWLDVHDVPLFGNVRVGQWRQPFGLDELTSVRELTFLERPTMFGFAPFRQTGIGFHNLNEEQTLTWAGSAFGFPTDAWGNSLGDRGFGTAERLTYLAQHECDGRRVLHFGVDHSFNVPNNGGLVYRGVPEYGGPFGSPAVNATGAVSGDGGDVPFFFNTGALPANYSHLANLELAGVHDSLHWQSELRYAFIDMAGETITLPSAYVQAGYLLTGEVRPYNKVAGVLGRIKPIHPWGVDGGLGAWELTLRYSYVNANPAAPFAPPPAPGAPPFGGELSDFTSGLNWYLNPYTKFQFNYILVELNRGGVLSTTNIAAVRAQLDF